jgi:RelE toxin of RelE / RelB toxin-antitoxin system
MFNAGSYMITIGELADFIEDSKRVFTETEYEELILFLAEHPDAGEVIPGTGGVRKVRWPARGHGKRGGARVIYYFRDLNVPVYLLAVYAKGEKLNLTQREKKIMSRYVDLIVKAVMAKRLRVVKRA